jgi:hypothetical protein
MCPLGLILSFLDYLCILGVSLINLYKYWINTATHICNCVKTISRKMINNFQWEILFGLLTHRCDPIEI